MKPIPTLLIIAALCCIITGCANVHATKSVTSASTNVTFRGTSFMANSAFKNLGVDGSTKTTSSLLKMSGATTEPNPEAITATGDALGNFTGTAAAAFAKGMAGTPPIPAGEVKPSNTAK